MPPVGFPFEKVRNRPTAWKPTAVNEIPCVELGPGRGRVAGEELWLKCPLFNEFYSLD